MSLSGRLIQARQAPKIDTSHVKKWRQDLRRMTKIYRSIDTSPWNYPGDEKKQQQELLKFNEARGLFRTFSKNFEKWYRFELLPLIEDRNARAAALDTQTPVCLVCSLRLA